MNKGFLFTDATGNVVYVGLGKTAGELSRLINDGIKAGECVPCVNNLKTVQRYLFTEYLKAKDDETFREVIRGKAMRKEMGLDE